MELRALILEDLHEHFTLRVLAAPFAGDSPELLGTTSTFLAWTAAGSTKLVVIYASIT